jgi:phosphoenolpyruvate carboxykinase (GTP)
MGDYLDHWLKIGKRLSNPPKVFSVNWFRTDDNGKYIWPGFGDNIRVLKWMIDRINNKVEAKETPIGRVPHMKDIDLTGLNIPKENMEKLFNVDIQGWKRESADIEEFFKKFGDRMPKEMWDELNAMKAKL